MFFIDRGATLRPSCPPDVVARERGAGRRCGVLARRRHIRAEFRGSDDQNEQDFGETENQNELPSPTKHITVEMHEGTNMSAVPSPDGRKMVLSLQGGLWIVSASGGTATKITPWNVESTQPVWSPDGEWIAFQNYSTAANFAIWVVKRTVRNVTRSRAVLSTTASRPGTRTRAK